MYLYIIRHGETNWNKEMRLQGQSDIPLNEYGIDLAKVTADALKDVNFDCVYSSPLSRAYETAKILVQDKCPIIKDERLKEISFGVDEGVNKDELGDHFTNFFFSPEKYTPSEGGETIEELCHRTLDFLEDIIYPMKDTDKKILIVAHGALNKAIMANLKNVSVADFWKGEFQRNCCVNQYEITNTDFRIIEEATIYYDGESTNYLEK